MTIVSWAAAIIAALPIASADVPVWGRIVLAGVAAAFGIMGGWLRRRSSRLAGTFEVSPFGFSEVRGAGLRRVLWEMPLVLRNNRRAHRFELSVHGAPGQIDIPYAVVQIERLVGLIIERGGLVGEPPKQPLQPAIGEIETE
jgi:hypothetical protein